jgi:hypothetical protein
MVRDKLLGSNAVRSASTKTEMILEESTTTFIEDRRLDPDESSRQEP